MSEQLYRISFELSKLLDNAFGYTDIVKCRRLVFSCLNSPQCYAEYFVHVIGSLCDGCNTEGSDVDIMRVLKNVYVEDTACVKYNRNAPFLAVTSPRSSYVTILLNRPTHIRQVLYECTNVIYYERKLLLCNSFFLQNTNFEERVDIVGPSSVTIERNLSNDNVLAFKCYYWPNIAKEWIHRHRKYSWPHSKLVHFIEQEGCHYVPVGEYDSPYCHVEWRVSFVLSECILVRSFNHVQFKVYNLLKLFKLHLQNVYKHPITRESLISSYHMKTIIFFVIENSPISLWSNQNMILCFQMCLIYLRHFVLSKYLPHYFLLQCNLFKKLSGAEHETNKIVLEISRYISNPIILLRMLVRKYSHGSYVNNDVTKHMLYSGIRPYTTDIKMQVCIRSMLDNFQLISEFEFIMIAKQTFDSMYCKYNCYERCVQHKIIYTTNRKIKYCCLGRSHFDAATGWLQLSNLYYVTQEYSKTEQICMNVLQSLSSTVVINGNCSGESTLLRALVNRQISEQQMVKQFTTSNILLYLNGLYPSELDIEVANYPKKTLLIIPPLPYAYFLLFLCAYHRHDVTTQRDILGTLELLLYDEHHGLRPNDFYTFIIFNLIGICYELSGDNERASFYYRKSINIKTTDNIPNPNTEAAYIRLQLLAMQRQ